MKQTYRQELKLILEQLGTFNQHLANRLDEIIKDYILQYEGKKVR